MTAGGLLDEIAQLLANKGLERPRREALRLLSDLTGAPVGTPLARPDAPVPPALITRARDAAARRGGGMPLAYATGVAHFRQLTLQVDPRVLIPRPETEGLVDHALAWQARGGGGGTAVDVGTGSGCVALSLAREAAFDLVIGADRSRDALAVARANAGAAGARVPVRWYAGDLLGPVAEGALAAVVANPPYVTATEWEGLAPDVRDFEPREALVAADDGLALIDRLAREAHSRLRGGGLLALEVDSQRAERARARVAGAGFGAARIEEDLFGRPRYVLAIKE